MCRNIKTLSNFDPPATKDEIQAAALQFVRKVSGSALPSKKNHAAFEQATAQISASVAHLLDTLSTTAPPRNRETEAAKAKARSVKRYGESSP
jgi:hypothetical protein